MFHPRGPPGPMGMRGPGPLPGELTYPMYFAVEGCDFIVLFAVEGCDFIVLFAQLHSFLNLYLNSDVKWHLTYLFLLLWRSFKLSPLIYSICKKFGIIVVG